jgi:hypothetical protein
VADPLYTMPEEALKRIRGRAVFVLGTLGLVVGGYFAAALWFISGRPLWYEMPSRWLPLLPPLIILIAMFFLSPTKQMIQIVSGLDRLAIFEDGLIPLIRPSKAEKNRRLTLDEIAEIRLVGKRGDDAREFVFTVVARDGGAYFVPSGILETLGVDEHGLLEVRGRLLEMKAQVDARRP